MPETGFQNNIFAADAAMAAPTVTSPARNSIGSKTVGLKPGVSLRILLAEDDPANAFVASIPLEQLGHFDLHTVRNGREAVERVIDGNYSLLIMDMNMPEIDGLEAARMIRIFEKRTGRAPLPIICVTANVLVGDRERCLDAGMNDYLAKPFTMEAFRQKIDGLGIR